MSKTFNGSSDKLKDTDVVPTLEAPLKKGRSTIWCASFLTAWKALEGFAGESIRLEEEPAEEVLLNKANDPRSYIPNGSFVFAVGWKQKGVLEQIQSEIKRAFPGRPAPAFPGIADDSFVAYSYLEANVKFSLPYFQSVKPLEFTDSNRRKINVKSFGIRSEDAYACRKLRTQPRVLFRTSEGKELEFGVDLDSRSMSSQVVVVRIKQEPTLAAALSRVEREQAEFQKVSEKDPGYANYLEEIGPNDVLLVPNFFWQISHRFSELEGKAFKNPSLKGQRLDVAQQDICFRLDRSGAELKAESKMYSYPIPRYFVLDSPFLIYMKQRGATTPYFVMWVDNAELIAHW